MSKKLTQLSYRPEFTLNVKFKIYDDFCLFLNPYLRRLKLFHFSVELPKGAKEMEVV